MQELLAHPEEARRLGAAAREVARERFGLDRFARDWNRAFAEALGLRSTALAASA
jgi:glycosyltransferase involved in cell wall biosynthesis